jgi:hypothetical protein
MPGHSCAKLISCMATCQVGCPVSLVCCLVQVSLLDLPVFGLFTFQSMFLIKFQAGLWFYTERINKYDALWKLSIYFGNLPYNCHILVWQHLILHLLPILRTGRDFSWLTAQDKIYWLRWNLTWANFSVDCCLVRAFAGPKFLFATFPKIWNFLKETWKKCENFY